MFMKSAANDQLQGRAIQAVNEKWGEDFRKWGGRETIGIPVCKKKYSPFCFSIVRHDEDEEEEDDDEEGDDEEEEEEEEEEETNNNDNDKNTNSHAKRRRPRLEVKVTRMFGCKAHHHLRKSVIEQHGCRNGWEPFGMWSMKKAQRLARKETERLNQPRVDKVSAGLEDSSDGTTSEDWTSSDDEKLSNNMLPSMCNNGSCTWKVKAKYDDIFREIHGDSDDEE